MKPNTVTSGHVSTRVCRRGKRDNSRHPARKTHLQGFVAMQKVEQRRREGLRACRRADGVPQGHLLERKQQIGAGFDADGQRCNLLEFPLLDHPLESRLAQHIAPAAVGIPLIIAFPIDISLVPEAAGEQPQELAARFYPVPRGRCRQRGQP
jgi:hypothetical protein